MSGMFKIGGYVIEPSHGLGKLISRNVQTIGEKEIDLLEIYFQSDDMRIFVPFAKVRAKGIRTLISKDEINKIYDILKEDSRGMRVIWSKRSREYNKKILTGDITMIAEVVRDLYKNTNNPNRSYSERVIFDKAMFRLIEEMAAVLGISNENMETKISDLLGKYHETYQDSMVEENIEIDEDLEAVANDA
jgi:CarD family transcriptional regulator